MRWESTFVQLFEVVGEIMRFLDGPRCAGAARNDWTVQRKRDDRHFEDLYRRGADWLVDKNGINVRCCHVELRATCGLKLEGALLRSGGGDQLLVRA